MSKDLYEVYVAYDKQGNPLYVGQGAKDRHKHCTSGKSHNKLLNKFYFTQGWGVVTVARTLLIYQKMLLVLYLT